MNVQELSRIVSAAAAEVHESLEGVGMEAKIYRNALAFALKRRGLTAERHDIPPGSYNGVKITKPTIVEMVVNDLLVVECKAEPKWKPAFEAEALAHLRLTGLKLALVINFGEESIRDGIRRVVNQL